MDDLFDPPSGSKTVPNIILQEGFSLWSSEHAKQSRSD